MISYRGQARDWYTHGRTHTHTHTNTQTQATIIPEGQNWVKTKHKHNSICVFTKSRNFDSVRCYFHKIWAFPVSGAIPSQRTNVDFGVSYDVSLNKLLNMQSRGRWIEISWSSLGAAAMMLAFKGHVLRLKAYWKTTQLSFNEKWL